MHLQRHKGTRLFSFTIAAALISFALLAQSALACDRRPNASVEESLDVRNPLFAEKLAARYQDGVARLVVKPVSTVSLR